MNNKNQPTDIDPTLLEKIRLLEKAPERDPGLAAQTRNKFLSQVERVPLSKTGSISGRMQALFGFTSREGAAIRVGRRKFALSTIAALLLVVVILFGGASATAYASQSSLPGDALYPVKTSLEQTQIALANDAYNQAQLHLEFAHRRLNEIKELLAQGRTNDIEYASSQFENYIQQAMMASQTVQVADPERGAELNKLVSQALLDYASTLKSVLVNAPEPVRAIVEKALLVSQDGAGDEIEVYGIADAISDTEIEIEGVVYSITELTEFKDLIQPGDFVKLHVIVTLDGAMVVREIELTDMADGENANESDEGNENTSEFDDDMNDNGSGDDSNENGSSENSNDNGSDDDSNENESNENESEEDDESDDGNENQSNQNMNENDSDDDELENESSKSGNSNEESDNNNRNENDSDDNSNDSDSNDNETEEEEEEDNTNGDD